MLKQKILVLSCIYTYFSLFSPEICAAPAEERTLSLGEQQSISVEEGTKFSVGNPDIIHVKNVHLDNGGNMLLVRAKKLGDSDLVLLGGAAGGRQIAFHVYSKKKAR